MIAHTDDIERLKSDKDYAINLLHAAGITDNSGRLTKEFGGEADHKPPLPRCYNRPALAGQWMRAGYRCGKIRLVWVPHRMSQPCKAWDSPDGYVTDPERLGWNCLGCQWIPESAKKLYQ